MQTRHFCSLRFRPEPGSSASLWTWMWSFQRHSSLATVNTTWKLDPPSTYTVLLNRWVIGHMFPAAYTASLNRRVSILSNLPIRCHWACESFNLCCTTEQVNLHSFKSIYTVSLGMYLLQSMLYHWRSESHLRSFFVYYRTGQVSLHFRPIPFTVSLNSPHTCLFTCNVSLSK